MVNPMAVFLPLYLYPSGTAWSNVTQAVARYPNLNFQIVVAPDLSTGLPDANYIAGLEALNTFENVQTLGYVPTAWATRDFESVQSDVATYASWANYSGANIHVSGIFFDEAPSIVDDDNISYMANATTLAKQLFAKNNAHIIFNPGVPVASTWYAYADEIIVFENTYAEFDLPLLDDIQWNLMKKSIFLIYDFTEPSHIQADLLSNLTDSNVGAAYVTTQDGYDEISELWSQLCSQLNMQESSPWNDRDDDDTDSGSGSDSDSDSDSDADDENHRHKWRGRQYNGRGRRVLRRRG